MHIRPFVTVEWYGNEYHLKATMGAINEIEGLGVDPVRVAQAAASGTVMRGQLSTIYAVLLRHAGVNVSNDDVYSGMFGGADVTTDDLLVATSEALALIFPQNTGGEAAKKKLPKLIRKAGNPQDGAA